MKIRIKGNSLRLRLTQNEVKNLLVQGNVREKISFAPQQYLVYELSAKEVDEVQAHYQSDIISIFIPKAMAKKWADTEQVSILHDQIITKTEVLKILIEKDFTCLITRKGEDDKDAFPNPLQKS